MYILEANRHCDIYPMHGRIIAVQASITGQQLPNQEKGYGRSEKVRTLQLSFYLQRERKKKPFHQYLSNTYALVMY